MSAISYTNTISTINTTSDRDQGVGVRAAL